MDKNNVARLLVIPGKSNVSTIERHRIDSEKKIQKAAFPELFVNALSPARNTQTKRNRTKKSSIIKEA